ncbi:MAG: hypothetical protein EON93_01310 [Burkholderiales bacterium]|nr:MAG: hypothetical protein EON93_01310 [Burkholderiales bacterium]
MTKLERARIILSQVLSLERRIGVTPQNDDPNPARNLRTVKIEDRWFATIRRGETRWTRPPADLPRGQWDQLHLEVGGILKLGLRFLDEKVDIIKFEPGTWELWFNTYDPTDTELVRP